MQWKGNPENGNKLFQEALVETWLILGHQREAGGVQNKLGLWYWFNVDLSGKMTVSHLHTG